MLKSEAFFLRWCSLRVPHKYIRCTMHLDNLTLIRLKNFYFNMITMYGVCFDLFMVFQSWPYSCRDSRMAQWAAVGFTRSARATTAQQMGLSSPPFPSYPIPSHPTPPPSPSHRCTALLLAPSAAQFLLSFRVASSECFNNVFVFFQKSGGFSICMEGGGGEAWVRALQNNGACTNTNSLRILMNFTCEAPFKLYLFEFTRHPDTQMKVSVFWWVNYSKQVKTE